MEKSLKIEALMGVVSNLGMPGKIRRYAQRQLDKLNGHRAKKAKARNINLEVNYEYKTKNV
jgi:hypothetical protein